MGESDELGPSQADCGQSRQEPSRRPVPIVGLSGFRKRNEEGRGTEQRNGKKVWTEFTPGKGGNGLPTLGFGISHWWTSR